MALLAAAFIWPLFQIEYFDNWMSIDGAFIADARFLKENLPHPGWQPLWYCGTRFDYIYPPAVRYGSALLSLATGMSVARAYHFYSAVFLVLGVAGVYALVRAAGRSRRSAWLAALAALVLSPALLIFPDMRSDSVLHMPQRLNVVVKWGEVPHMSALAVLCFALAAAWLGVGRARPAMLATAGVLASLTAANNFYGATALAILFPLLLWALWVERRDAAIWWRGAAVAALAFGLAAFWLTPSYLRVTLENLRFVAEPGNWWSRAVLSGALGGFAWLTWRAKQAWPVFIAGALLVFSLIVIGKPLFGFRVFGEPHRLVPELDLLLILAAVECLRRRWWPLRAAGATVLAASLVVAFPYLRRPWGVFVPDPNPERRIEYRLTEWLHHNLPGARVFATGSLRFWYSVWRDLAEVGGGSDQGMLNPMMSMAQWQITMGSQADRDLYWLQALGADAIVVHGKRSQEMYHHIARPGKFRGLPLLFDSGQDDFVYRVPRRFPGLARVVERSRAASLQTIGWHDNNRDQLRAYVDALEHGPDSPADTEWLSPREMRIRADLRDGESVAVLVSYDPAWRACSDGRRLEIRPDAVRFLRVDAPPGRHEIHLRFETPLENRIGRVLSLITFGVVVWLWIPAWRRNATGIRH